MDIREVEAKSILVKSKLPDTDYVINPYTGCRFGCVYCYASFMSRYIGRDTNDWGEFVYVKINAPELLKTELYKIRNHGKNKSIFLSSVTDPYQGVEAKYKITRKCLEVIISSEYEGLVSILTKSPMVTRDIDLFKKLRNVEVGLTVTSVNDSVSRYFEKYAPNVSQRFDALKILNDAGISTYAFVGPLLPTYVKNIKELEEIFKSIHNTGTKSIYVEHINMSKYILERLLKELPNLSKEDRVIFEQSKTSNYRKQLDEKIGYFISKYELTLKTGDTIYHKNTS